MSEFKFSCNSCNQHIAVEEAWSGHQIQCPNCQTNLVVPPNPARMAPPPVLPVSAPPPQPGPAPMRPAAPKGAAPVKFWILALAPLPLAFFGFLAMGIGILVAKSMYGSLIGLIGMVPAVLCAHAAINEKKSNRAISGSQVAGIAAVIAYVGMVIAYLLILVVLFRTAQVTYYRMTGTTPPKSLFSTSSSSGRSTTIESTTPHTTTTPTRTVTTPARPADPPVTTDPQSVTIPESVPAGTVLGSPFKCTGIHYSPLAGVLDIDQGAASNPQASVKLFLFSNGTPLAGTSFVVAPNQAGMGAKQPHVHLKGSNGKVDALMSGYVLRLEFSQPDAKGILTGQLYLELPQSYQSKVSGTFKIQAQ